jgi:hypothetical protein
MRKKHTQISWVSVVLVLGHLAIILGLLLSTLAGRPARGTAGTAPSILDSVQD